MSERYGVNLTHIAEVEGFLGGVPDAEEGGGAEEVFRHLHLWFFVAFVFTFVRETGMRETYNTYLYKKLPPQKFETHNENSCLESVVAPETNRTARRAVR